MIQPLRERSSDLVSGFQRLASLIIGAWASRIVQYQVERVISSDTTQVWQLPATTFEATFPNGRGIKSLPESLRPFVKWAIKRHVRIFLDASDGRQYGCWRNSEYGQPEIEINIDGGTESAFFNGRRGYYDVVEMLETRRTTLIHELAHAYDDFDSEGKYQQNARTKQAINLRTQARAAGASDEIKQAAYAAYIDEPPEINARFYQTASRMRFNQPWQDLLRSFKNEFPNWRATRPEEQTALIKRLASEWTRHQPKRQIDIQPFVTKLNTRAQELFGKSVWIQNAHGNIEISGIEQLSPDAQQKLASQVLRIADIFRVKTVSYEMTPVMKSLGFHPNRGRSRDLRISAPYVRESVRAG